MVEEQRKIEWEEARLAQGVTASVAQAAMEATEKEIKSSMAAHYEAIIADYKADNHATYTAARAAGEARVREVSFDLEKAQAGVWPRLTAVT